MQLREIEYSLMPEEEPPFYNEALREKRLRLCQLFVNFEAKANLTRKLKNSYNLILNTCPISLLPLVENVEFVSWKELDQLRLISLTEGIDTQTKDVIYTVKDDTGRNQLADLKECPVTRREISHEQIRCFNLSDIHLSFSNYIYKIKKALLNQANFEALDLNAIEQYLNVVCERHEALSYLDLIVLRLEYQAMLFQAGVPKPGIALDAYNALIEKIQQAQVSLELADIEEVERQTAQFGAQLENNYKNAADPIYNVGHPSKNHFADINKALNKFKQSKSYKTLLAKLKADVNNPDFVEFNWQEAISTAFTQYQDNNTRLFSQYARNDLVDRIELVMQMDFAATLKPFVHDHLYQIILAKLTPQFFIENTYVNQTDDFETLTQATHDAWQELITEKSPGIAALISGLRENDIVKRIITHATQLAAKVSSLQSFKDKPLTYAMLQQCITIWRANNRGKLPRMMQKINQIIENRDNESLFADEITPEALTVLELLINKYPQKGHLINIVRALESTTTLKNSPNNKKVAARESAELNIANMKQKLQQMQNELTSINFSSDAQKQTVTATLRALEQILALSGLDKYDPANELAAAISREKFETEDTLIHLKRGYPWKSTQDAIQFLVNDYIQAYNKAAEKGQVKTLWNSLSGYCLEARLDSLEATIKRLISPRFDSILLECDTYLVSTGKSLSYENRLKFITKGYINKTYFSSKNEYIPLTKREIEACLSDYSEKAYIKRERKNDLIDYYYHHNFLTFNKKLVGVRDLTLRGLNRLTKEGDTLLIDACRRGEFDYVEALVTKGVDLYIINKKGQSAWDVALNLAEKPEYCQIACRILDLFFTKLATDEDKQNQAERMLMQAYQQKNGYAFQTIAKYVREGSLEINRPELGNIPLFKHACQENKVHHLCFPNAENQDESFMKKMIKPTSANEIICAHFEVNGHHFENQSYLIVFAIKQGNFHLFKALLDAMPQATPEEKTNKQVWVEKLLFGDFLWGDKPCHNEIFKTILNAYLTFEQSDKNKLSIRYKTQKETLLTKACKKDNYHAALLLLEKEIDLSIPNSSGKTPFFIAFEANYGPLAGLLLKKWIKKGINEADKQELSESLVKKLKLCFPINTQDSYQDQLFATLAILQKKTPELVNQFFTNNVNELIALIETQTQQLDKCGFFNLLPNCTFEQNCSVFDLLLSAKQTDHCLRVLDILLEESKDKFDAHLSELLKKAYKAKDIAVFTKLIEKCTDLSILDNQIADWGNHTLLTKACEDKQNSFITALLPVADLIAIGKEKPPLAWVINSKDKAMMTSFLEAMRSRSYDISAHIIAHDLLGQAYIYAKSPDLFKQLFVHLNNYNIPGLHLPHLHPNLEGCTFLEDSLLRWGDKTEYVQFLHGRGLQTPLSCSLMHMELYDNAEIKAKTTNRMADFRHFADALLYSVNISEKRHAFIKFNYAFDEGDHSIKGAIYGYSAAHRACRELKPLALDDDNSKDAAIKQDTRYGKTALHHLLALRTEDAVRIDSRLHARITDQLSALQDGLGVDRFNRNLEIKDHDGRLPIHYACRRGSSILAAKVMPTDPRLLLITDRIHEKTPLHYALENKMEFCAELITKLTTHDLLAEALSKADRYGHVPLHQANTPGLISLLIDNNANCNVVNIDGDTPLHFACRQGNKSNIQALLRSPSALETLTLKNKEQKTPLDELPKRSPIRDYLQSIIDLQRYAQKLSNPLDASSPEDLKAQAIVALIRNVLGKSNMAEQIQTLTSELANVDAPGHPPKALFQVRQNGFGYLGRFFKAQNEKSTTTFKKIEVLKERLEELDRAPTLR